METMKQILRCELADGVRHDWEHCGAIQPMGIEDPPPENFYLCTQPKGHTGPHIACCSSSHNLATWPNEDALERGEIAFAPIPIPPGPVEFSALEARISALECDSHKPVSIPIGALEARISALERQIRELNPGLPPL